MIEKKCASFFAGVGGIDKGFELAGFETIFANEMDKNASETFKANFEGIPVIVEDINNLDENNDIPNFDIMLAGFPCQAFSIAGHRKGFDDDKGRGSLFFELVRIIKVKKPKVIFLENVKNLVAHDEGNTFAIINKTLEDLGYHVKYMVLNSSQYGNTPQSRERIYIVCFKNKKHYQKFDFPKPVKLVKNLESVIDFNGEKESRYYYNDSCVFYEKLKEGINKSDTCYQWRRVYVRENKSNLCPTLTANMGTGGHNVPIIKTHTDKIRKLTPRECFNLQGFPNNFILPSNLSNASLYKQAGNSVAVTVIERIASKIMEAIS